MNQVQILLTQEEKDRLRKLANYLAVGVSPRQAGAAIGLTEGRISQLASEDNNEPSALYFREEFERATAENVEGFYDANAKREQIIKKALDNIDSALNYNVDPDLSLKALNVVSKLPRAGVMPHNGENRPLRAGDGARITLTLNQAFVVRAREGEVSSRTLEGQILNKESNFMNPQSVEKLLADKRPLSDALESVRRAFDNLGTIPGPEDV